MIVQRQSRMSVRVANLEILYENELNIDEIIR